MYKIIKCLTEGDNQLHIEYMSRDTIPQQTEITCQLNIN